MDFYYMELSPPCRAVMLTAKALGVHLNKFAVDLSKGEQMDADFLEMNPCHCVPTLVDDDLKLWESRAICTYLVSAYGNDDSLYPEDRKQRALVDKMLYFDIGTLVAKFHEYLGPALFDGERLLKPKKLEQLHHGLELLGKALELKDYVCGDEITVADFSIVATISSYEEAGIEISKHERVDQWLRRCENTMEGYEEENLKGARLFGDFVRNRLSE